MQDRRVAVVTGAARGIGQAIAEGLAATGAQVAAVDVADAGGTVAAIRAQGGTGEAFVADVASEPGTRDVVDRVRETLGPVVILVNNAARLGTESIFDLDYETWRARLTANLDSQFLMAKAVLPDMVSAGWGRVVNVASSSLLTTTPGITAYMASKGGVLGFTSGLANDVGRFGITVNAVSPGLTRTPGVDADIAAGLVPAGALEAVVSQQAIPRAGTPQDVVGAVCFLASDAASFVTGQFIVADGGMTRH